MEVKHDKYDNYNISSGNYSASLSIKNGEFNSLNVGSKYYSKEEILAFADIFPYVADFLDGSEGSSNAES